jgi:uncharacterized protein (DUF2141 family)
MRPFYSAAALAIVLALGVAPGANAEPSGKLTVSVIGVRSDSGAVRCGLYSSPAGFREPGHELRGAVAQIKNGLAACVFNGLPAGTYAVAVFHAEHNETQMETGLFGKPKQGYGFSNNPASTFGPPSFNSAAFEYKPESAGAAELLALLRWSWLG